MTLERDWITVVLTWGEVFQAGLIGLMRLTKNLQNGAIEKHGAAGDSLDYHFHGCLGELALAKWRNTFWSGSLGDYRAVDVGNRWQVRCAGRLSDRLILHPEDSDTDPFVLALAPHRTLPRVFLCGWIAGMDGKQEQFWADPKTGRPAFFVPQAALLGMEDLC